MIENPIFGGEQIQFQFDFDGFACKNRKTMGRKEPGPHNLGKKWPGEAHKQPQLATQYYLRAIDIAPFWNRSRGIRLGEKIYENKH